MLDNANMNESIKKSEIKISIHNKVRFEKVAEVDSFNAIVFRPDF